MARETGATRESNWRSTCRRVLLIQNEDMYVMHVQCTRLHAMQMMHAQQCARYANDARALTPRI